MSIVHAVERLNWRATRFRDDKWNLVWQGFVLLPGGKRLRSFDTQEEADAFCAEQEQALRVTVNPFSCGGPALHYQTGLDADRLHDWLLDAGLEPPPRGEEKIDWHGWWEQTAPQMNETQRLAAWQALDKVRFHRVVERPKRPTIFIVTQRNWEYNDQWYDPDSVEGKAISAYSTYEKAEEVRRQREATARRGWVLSELEVTRLRWAALEPGQPLPERHSEFFAEEHEHLFFDVIEVELGG